MPTPPDPATNGTRLPETERGGARRFSASRVFKKGITADEADPTDYRDGLAPPSFHGVAWGVLMPAGATSYTLKVWKLVTAYHGDVVVAEEWVLEDTYAGLTRSVIKHQPVDGCRITVTIDDIVIGAATDAWVVTWNGVNRHL